MYTHPSDHVELSPWGDLPLSSGSPLLGAHGEWHQALWLQRLHGRCQPSVASCNEEVLGYAEFLRKCMPFGRSLPGHATVMRVGRKGPGYVARAGKSQG